MSGAAVLSEATEPRRQAPRDGRRPAPTHSESGSAPFDLAAVLCFAWATLAVGGFLPLVDPASATLSTHAGALGGVLIVASSSTEGRWRGLAVVLLLVVLAGCEAPREIALIGAVGAVAWMRHGDPQPRVLRAIGALALSALVVGSLKRSFDPLLLDQWIHRSIVARATGTSYSSDVGAAIYGLLLLPVGLAGLMSTGASALVRGLGTCGLLGALLYARHGESAWPMVIAVLALPTLALAASGCERAAVGPRPRIRAVSTVLWLTLVAFASVLGWRSSASSPVPARSAQLEAPRIGFIGAMHGSFDPLPLSGAGPVIPSRTPRFGELRRLLERIGARTVTLTGPEDLDATHCDALVTINFHGPTARGFGEPIRSAVSAGADLLVLADHTDLFQQIRPTNDLLRETGIELAFDSAVPCSPGGAWSGSVEAGRDPVFGPHRDGRSFGWGVGCSLHVDGRARTLAAGSNAFLDAGVASKPGGLDNLQRDPEEDLGGFPIAASSVLGAGRVLVLGDTSALQDTALLAGREFALRVCGWLLGGARDASDLPGNAVLARLALMLALLAALFVDLRVRIVLAASLALALGEPCWERRMRAALELEEPSVSEVSLLTGYLPGIALGSERIDPLLEQCASLGWSLRTRASAGDVPLGPAFVLIDPWAEIPADEARDLLDRVHAGGRMLLFLGERGSRSARSILDAFGLSLGVPLGRGAISAWTGALAGLPGAPQFQSSHEIVGRGLASVEVVATCFGRPVAVTGRLGEGRWLLVADAGLGFERHVETTKGGTLLGALTLQRMLQLALTDAEAR